MLARTRTLQPSWKSEWVGYGLSVLFTAGAYLAQRAIWSYIPPSPQLLFYPAVFLAGRFGGFGPGLVATLLSALGMAQAFLPPGGVLAVDAPEDALDLAIFMGVGSGMSWALGRLRGALAFEREVARNATLAKKATDETWEMMAHDLRGPLNVITLSSEALGRRLHDGEPDVERVIGAIQRSTKRARELVQDAVEAMRLEEGGLVVQPAPCPVASLAEEASDAIAPLAQKKRIVLEIDHDGGATLCDRKRILQVLTNLLGNAVKFTPEGGRVSLELASRAGKVCVAVTDTGPGIPEDQLASLFSRYWTRDRSSGFGLGLWIASTIVEAHGEKLQVSSAVGRGSRFSFELPRAEVAVRAPVVRTTSPA
ncbi:MAG: HAMP domain-containing histidine kinase [Labilithrix sp.]|nr:HAMP domain-containing histidine kinase [Labilithrix sp.]